MFVFLFLLLGWFICRTIFDIAYLSSSHSSVSLEFFCPDYCKGLENALYALYVIYIQSADSAESVLDIHVVFLLSRLLSTS